jgi:putative spermidine/putrescine transport system permease protein
MPGSLGAPVVGRQSEKWMKYAFAALLAPVVVILLAPSLVVIPMSFSESSVLAWPPQGFTSQWYVKLFASAEWLDSAKNSVEVAFAATIICVVLGVPAGLAFGLRDWRGKQLALAFVVAPLIIPTIVLAIGMYEIYARFGLSDLWELAVGHAAIGAPFVVITTMSASRQINPVLLLAARSLGARPVSVFLNITLPIIALGVTSGAVFAFVTSWDEVVIAKFLTSPTFQTIPVQMWNQLTEGVDPTVAAMATILFAVSMSAMVALVGLRRVRG